MRKAFCGILLLFVSGCTSIYSPYDLYEMCMTLGSTRITSVGAKAQNYANCTKELQEDLQDPTPRILYIPKDIVMAPVIASRALWSGIALTKPPY